ncbi:uncharacterized protein VSU04_011741 isoform 1-T1 [Chlamydotis macqueenii]
MRWRGDKGLRKPCTMPLRWQGSPRLGVGERRCQGHPGPCPSSRLPLPCAASPLLCSIHLSRPRTSLFPLLCPVLPAAVGCVVGSWGPWSGCSSPCGVGSKARSRQVTVPPRHGGEPCPDLKQRRGCLGEHPTCGMAKGNGGLLGVPTCLVCDRPSGAAIPAASPRASVTVRVCPRLLFCQRWPRYYLTPSAGASGIPGEELGSCCRRSRPGRAPLPRAGLEPPAAAGQAGVRRVPGGRIPPLAPLHWTRAARSQDVLGGCLCAGVPGLVGAGGAAGGLCLPLAGSRLRVASPRKVG